MLTNYEQGQVEKIASWKASNPNPFGELLHRVTKPVAKFVELIIPDAVALSAIEAVYKASELAASQRDIKLSAGVSDLSELRQKPLQVCDDLSRRVGTLGQGVAMLEGALTGAGGVWTTLLDIPLLYAVCIGTIIKVGHCYGYALDRPTDKAWVLGALTVALSDSRENRTELMVNLRTIEDLLLEDIQEDIVVEATASLLTQVEIFEDIPLFGAAGGSFLNLWVAHRADVTARYLFQERWLRDNGKIDNIEPARIGRGLAAMNGWKGALARAGYSSLYGLSFGAALPIQLALAFFAPIASGFRNRAAGALHDLDGSPSNRFDSSGLERLGGRTPLTTSLPGSH
jgi:EcsC protein family